MSGTFEEARESYKKFYGLDFRKYGVDIPPRLEEITKNKKLLETAQEPLQLNKKQDSEPSLLEHSVKSEKAEVGLHPDRSNSSSASKDLVTEGKHEF